MVSSPTTPTESMVEIDYWGDSVDPPTPKPSEEEQPAESKSFLVRIFSRSAVHSSTKQPVEKSPPDKWMIGGILAVFVCLFLVILASILLVVILFVLVLVPPQDDVVQMMNLSADPCTDFYNYACGGWQVMQAEEKSSRIVSLYTLEDTIDRQLADMLKQEVRDGEAKYKTQAKKFFSACNNIERLTQRGNAPFLEFLKSFGKFPILETNWKKEETNIQSLITQLTRFGIATVFQVVPQRSKNLPKFIVSVTPRPGVIDTNEAEQILRLLGVSDNNKNFRTEFDEMISVRNLVNKIVYYGELETANLKIKDMEHRMHLEFDFNWMKFFKDLGESTSLTSDTEVTVENRLHIMGYQKVIFDRFQIRDIINFLMLPLLTYTHLLDPRFHLKRRIQTQDGDERTAVCLDRVKEVFTVSLRKMYVDEYYDAKHDSYVKNMVKDLKAAFIANMTASTWLTSKEITATKEHLETMKEHIGYLEQFEDVNFMNELFGKVPADEYFEYYTELYRYIISSGFTSNYNKTIYQLKDPIAFDMNSLYPKIKYLAEANNIALSASFLQKPKTSPTWPASMNYGALGSEIAAALMYLWTEKFRIVEEAKDKSSKILERLSSCELSSFKGDPNIPLQENIKGSWAKDGVINSAGLKASYQAYKLFQKRGESEVKVVWGLEKDKDDQIFFLGYAQSFCELIPRNLRKVAVLKAYPPAHLRVRAALSKFKAFSDAYECKPGDAMYPKTTCDFFRNEVSGV